MHDERFSRRTSSEVCIGNVKRTWEYGLNYYSVTPLPKCEQNARPLRLMRAPGDLVALEPAP